MNLVKRITASVTAKLDSAVGQIENHDAIVEASIKTTRQAVAKTKARINTLRQQQAVYEKQLAEVTEQMDLWESRASKLAETDKEKALQCLLRRNQCQSENERLHNAIPQQAHLIEQVTANLQSLESKLSEMTQKHNLMRSRQTVAEVNRVVGSAKNDDDLRDTFERWESTVLEHELVNNDFALADPLETQLRQQENEQDLLAQLDQLVDTNKKEGSSDE